MMMIIRSAQGIKSPSSQGASNGFQGELILHPPVLCLLTFHQSVRRRVTYLVQEYNADISQCLILGAKYGANH